MNNSEFLPYDAFFSKLRNVSPLEKDCSDLKKLLSCGLETQEKISKMKLSKPPSSGEKITNLCFIYGITRICAHSKTFYAGATTKTLFQHSKQGKKSLRFFQKKEIDMLKLGCTLPNLANIPLHKSTSAKFYPFTETD